MNVFGQTGETYKRIRKKSEKTCNMGCKYKKALWFLKTFHIKFTMFKLGIGRCVIIITVWCHPLSSMLLTAWHSNDEPIIFTAKPYITYINTILNQNSSQKNVWFKYMKHFLCWYFHTSYFSSFLCQLQTVRIRISQKFISTSTIHSLFTNITNCRIDLTTKCCENDK